MRHPAVRAYFLLALPLMVGQSAVALDEQWPRYFGQFVGSGAQSSLYYARILNMLPVGVIAQAAGVAAFPFLAGLFSAGKSAEMRAVVVRSVRATVAVAGLASALVIVMAFPLVRIAFQWGAFERGDTDAVSRLLVFYAFSIPFWAAHQVYTRAFYAQQRMWTPVVIGSVITAAVIPSMFYAVDRFGASGIAVVSTISIALYTVAIAAAWHWGHVRSEGPEVGRSLARTFASAAVAGGAAAVTLATTAGIARIWSSLFAGAIGAVAYIAVGRSLVMSELDPVLDRIRRSGARSSNS
jgi:putative peptidoglycan lipid II flippase